MSSSAATASTARPLRRMDSSCSKSPSKPSFLHSPSVKAKVVGGIFSPKSAWKKSRWTSSSSRLSVDVADYYHGSWESSGNSRNSR